MLMEACHTTKSTVHAAFQVLCDLTCTQLLPVEQARDSMRAIVGMHGVHLLCHLLCPEVIPCHPDHEQAHTLAAQGVFCGQTVASKQQCTPALQHPLHA